MENTFPMVAKTFKGLEDVLRDELISLGAENVETGQRMVSFEGDLELMYKANLCCRTALRILKPIVKFTAYDPDELYDEVRDVQWEKFLTPEMTFSIDSTVNSSEFTHSRYVTYRVKDGIADHFNDIYGKRPSIRLSGADLQLNVHIFEHRVTISLDSSGEPLCKRGYREEQTEAPVNEVLAAGIILKTGWRGESNFVDPMCGSGTFLTEAALIAANINPGIFRESFAFEKWSDFDRDLFERIYNDDSEEKAFGYKIYGADIDPEAVAIARRNVKRAHLDDMIELSCRSFDDWEEIPEAGILVTNPPYGERLRPDDLTGLYRRLGTTLKQQFKGYHAWILGYSDEHFAAIGLKPSVKQPILNGNLECMLREYVLFDGSYSDFRSEGGSVHNSGFNRGDKVKVRHLSDSEWERDARKFSKNQQRLDSKREFKADKREFTKKDKYKRDYRSDKREYKSDKKDYRDGKKEYRNDKRENRSVKRENRDDRPVFRKERAAKPVWDREPRIPAEKATVFSALPVRSRRRLRPGGTVNDEDNNEQ